MRRLLYTFCLIDVFILFKFKKIIDKIYEIIKNLQKLPAIVASKL